MTPSETSIYAPAGTWVSYIDPSYWSIVQGTWAGTYWTSTPSLGLEVTGAWATGFRPTKVRVTFNGPTEGGIDINNNGLEGVLHQHPAYSEVEYDLSWSEGLDMVAFGVVSHDGSSTINVTDIEFFVAS